MLEINCLIVLVWKRIWEHCIFKPFRSRFYHFFSKTKWQELAEKFKFHQMPVERTVQKHIGIYKNDFITSSQCVFYHLYRTHLGWIQRLLLPAPSPKYWFSPHCSHHTVPYSAMHTLRQSTPLLISTWQGHWLLSHYSNVR